MRCKDKKKGKKAMRNVRLEARERRLLQALEMGGLPPTKDRRAQLLQRATLESLERKGLAAARYEEGGGAVDARVTSAGYLYLAVNPKMKNPTNWERVAQWVGIGAALAAAIGTLLARAGGAIA